MTTAFTPSASVSLDATEINSFTDGLMAFLNDSPVSFLAASNIAQRLNAARFSVLREEDVWDLTPGGRYYVMRNGSAVIAFCLPASHSCGNGTVSEMNEAHMKASDIPESSAFHIVASHLDSPTFRIKSNAEITVENQYITLNVEKYGGMILSTWLDRPLSVAGRVLVRTQNGIASRLINIDRDLMIIPSVAIHMNRNVNDGYKWDMKQDLRPLFCGLSTPFCLHADAASTDVAGANMIDADSEPSACSEEVTASLFRQLIAKEAGVAPADIIDTDLYLYNRQQSARTGLHQEFISSGRLDDLQCAYSSLAGFLAACEKIAATDRSNDGAPSAATCTKDGPFSSSCIPVFCAFDNEEVGSMTRQGADSSLLRDTLRRIGEKLGWTQEDFCRSIAKSFLISADNAHAVHPNHPELEDPTHRPVPNGGIVIKYSANQKYTTDAVSGAIMQELCRKAGVPTQIFYNRSDLLGGSTLGNISGTQLSIRTADIGLPQLAMHSAYETAGVLDGAYLERVCRLFYQGFLPITQGD